MTTPSIPRKSSTLLIIREVPHVEVLMMKRSLSSEIQGGAFVFPGGKVEDWDKPEAFSKRQILHEVCVSSEPDYSLACHKITAIRETFEEVGLLLGLARELDETFIERKDELRIELSLNQITFPEILEKYNICLDLNKLYFFSRWITPEFAPKRFDTYFFVTLCDSSQTAIIDNFEGTSLRWVGPKQALELNNDGEFPMVFPTIKNLEKLSKSNSFESLVASLDDSLCNKPITPRLATDKTGEAKLVLDQ